MFDVRRPKEKPMLVIRAASGYELSAYEKRKLANIEENAQENKIESIVVNNQRLQINPINKEVQINLGTLAFKQKVTKDDLSDDLFFIKCELDENSLEGEAL